MERCEPLTGNVFDIQRYSLHDGPGIRTLVFLKGCPLRCAWCSNPESQNPRAELAYQGERCIGTQECGSCLRACPHRAIAEAEGHKIAIDRRRCRACLRCAGACPARGLRAVGAPMSVEQVMGVVEADAIFYARSGGGLTVSGGEPLLQAGFTRALVEAARSRRIHTGIETCGYGEWPALEAIARRVDTVLFDIKCLDEDRHRRFTGVSNRVILENFRKLCAAFPELPVLVRTPVVPGFNDTREEIEAIRRHIQGISNVTHELLPYHRLGQPKYAWLGREYPLLEIEADQERLDLLTA